MNPQSNRPTMGLVQDSLLGCMLFTRRDTFISHEDLMNLSMWIDIRSDELEGQLPMPAILKPKPLWTGKQVFSLLLPRIQYTRYDRHGWAQHAERNILIRDGELLCG